MKLTETEARIIRAEEIKSELRASFDGHQKTLPVPNPTFGRNYESFLE